MVERVDGAHLAHSGKTDSERQLRKVNNGTADGGQGRQYPSPHNVPNPARHTLGTARTAAT